MRKGGCWQKSIRSCKWAKEGGGGGDYERWESEGTSEGGGWEEEQERSCRCSRRPTAAERRSCHSRLCSPPHQHQRPWFKSGIDPPSSGQHMRCCHAAGHTLCLAPLKSNPAEEGIEQSERHWGWWGCRQDFAYGSGYMHRLEGVHTHTQNPWGAATEKEK